MTDNTIVPKSTPELINYEHLCMFAGTNDRDPDALFANGLSLLFAFCGSLESCEFLHPELRSVEPDELAAFLSEAAIKFLTHC